MTKKRVYVGSSLWITNQLLPVALDAASVKKEEIQLSGVDVSQGQVVLDILNGGFELAIVGWLFPADDGIGGSVLIGIENMEERPFVLLALSKDELADASARRESLPTYVTETLTDRVILVEDMAIADMKAVIERHLIPAAVN